MVDTKTLKVNVGKVIDWILYIGLVCASTFLMVDCLFKYKNKSTYFEVTNKKEESIELPTITFCFEPVYKKSNLEEYNLTLFPSMPNDTVHSMKDIFERSSYEIGQDFTMSISDKYLQSFPIHKLGKVEMSKSSPFDIKIKSMINLQLGKCYNILLNHTQKDLKFAYVIVRLTIKEEVVSKPRKLKVNILIML